MVPLPQRPRQLRPPLQVRSHPRQKTKRTAVAEVVQPGRHDPGVLDLSPGAPAKIPEAESRTGATGRVDHPDPSKKTSTRMRSHEL